ncbi:exosome complex component RRP45 [Lingula anatina]|uniref:Exosome complex component RRP45 n=1 Tax=Lingula anatina TaxID=7574 RepID=A0A1S3JDX8_LINAN|nr:exosome complex component RRP45 [Lingula anatina]|eukprot:XP_013408376.1 exosome complex component RRP45 [Lingula anatina]
MREVPLTICEREFILKAIAERRRLDGREAYDYRKLKITFGIDRGCCSVELGLTRVLAQVSCEITEPKQTRPTEGLLNVNLELSPMAAPHFEAGRLSEYGVELNRLLERCIKDSRCIDTESLCIIAGEKVFSVRVDVHVLNEEGNIMDCASIAAMAALAHFRRPDVTVDGEEVTIHKAEEREPIPLSLHHMPICVTFAFYEQGKYLLVDPTEKEEKVMDGKMVIAMNKHREICTLQMTGNMLLLKDQVLRCSNIAVVKVIEITELIQKALENDSKARSSGEKFGFAASQEPAKVTANQQQAQEVDTEVAMEMAYQLLENGKDDEEEMESVSEVKILGPGTGAIGEGGANTWGVESEEENRMKENKTSQVNKKGATAVVDITGELSGDSEEEEVVVLEELDDTKTGKEKGDNKAPDTIDLTSALKPISKDSKSPAKAGEKLKKKKKTGR